MSKQFKVRAALTVSLLALGVSAKTAPILDQSNDNQGAIFCVGAANNCNWQQEIIAGVTGTLTGIELTFRTPGTFVLELWNGSPWQAGAPVYTESFVVSAAGPMLLDLSSAAFSVVDGEAFTFGTGLASTTGLSGSDSFQYAGNLGLREAACFDDCRYDLAFKTYVDPNTGTFPPLIDPVVGNFFNIASNAGEPFVSKDARVQPLVDYSQTVDSGLATSQLDVDVTNNASESLITVTHLSSIQVGGNNAGLSFSMQIDVLEEATYEFLGGISVSTTGVPETFLSHQQDVSLYSTIPFTELYAERDAAIDTTPVSFTINGVNEGNLSDPEFPTRGSPTGVLSPGRYEINGLTESFSQGGGFSLTGRTDYLIRFTPTGSVPGEQPPTADAGPNQAIHVGLQVTLNGNGSFDDLTPTEDLIYAWSFASVPPGSVLTALNDATTITPSFTADLPGDYVVSLVVTDQNGLSSVPDTVTVSSLNVPPIADAGADQGAIVGDFLTLDGSASSDPDFDPITYSWTLTGLPPGSAASITLPNNAFAHFVPDLPGIYTVELIVNDGFANSAPDETTITVVTAEAFAEMKAVEAINAIGALPMASVTTKGNQNAISQHLSQVVSALQIGDIDEAIFKLEEVIERTDGCTLRGAPDAGNGPGPQPKKDYVTDCIEQETIYRLLTEALEALSP